MPSVRTTVWFPEELWKAVQALAADEGDANTVVLRAVEEYVLRSHRRRTRTRPAKYKKLVETLSTPVEALQLSARAATCLRHLGIRYVYELVEKTPVDLRKRPNFGEKSQREVQDTLAALGLSLRMTLDGPSYAEAVMATVAARIKAASE